LAKVILNDVRTVIIACFVKIARIGDTMQQVRQRIKAIISSGS
jgi:hypothetical protein